MFSGIISRQKDGIYRQVELSAGSEADTFVKPNGEQTYKRLFVHTQGQLSLGVCELVGVEQHPSIVFNRSLPLAFSHTLIYGDILFVLEDNGVPKDFTLEDIYLIMKGIHPAWSKQTDITMEEDNDTPEEESESESEFEDSDDELTLRTENTVHTAKTCSDEEESSEDNFSDEEEEEDDDDEKVDNVDEYYEKD